MRMLLLGVGLLVTAILQVNSTPAKAEGAWCYLNETEHCTEVSFESCHFAVHGNGGYCYPNPNYRASGRSRAEGREAGRQSRPAEPFAFMAYRPTGVVYNDNTGNSRKSRRNDRPASDWMVSASFGYEQPAKVRTKKRHRHHKRTRHAAASPDMIPSIYGGLAVIAMARHGQSGDHVAEALASASPFAADSVTSGNVSSGNASTNMVAMRPAMTVPLVLPRGLPTINFARSCRTIAELGVGGSRGVDGCTASEMEARDQLAKTWDQFVQADRNGCVSSTTMGGGGTYTSLLTCLELKRDVKALPKNAMLGTNLLGANR
jgi:hypothetical protein